MLYVPRYSLKSLSNLRGSKESAADFKDAKSCFVAVEMVSFLNFCTSLGARRIGGFLVWWFEDGGAVEMAARRVADSGIVMGSTKGWDLKAMMAERERGLDVLMRAVRVLGRERVAWIVPYIIS
jgi:hypothetical protein